MERLNFVQARIQQMIEFNNNVYIPDVLAIGTIYKQSGWLYVGGLSATNYTARVDPGGSFAISGVPTGRYLLTARVASSVADPLFGSQPFS